MSLKELTQALMFVFVGLLWQNTNAQVYYDLYSDNESFKTRGNAIYVLANGSFSSSASNNNTKSNDSAVTTATTPTKNSRRLPRFAAVVLLALVIGILLAMWHFHFMQQRDFAMTEEDTQLSSTALSNNPPKRSLDLDHEFCIPMPDPILPQISVTPPSRSNSCSRE
ncbi:uncharacterized protein LOC141886100 isoform X2 [Acropora palmata]|uniref:uncharacterized protein LOC141886100 isoform X2 n=1 Tax=Acropora palmata TaxID=6131 RepID=UPI003DA0CFBA